MNTQISPVQIVLPFAMLVGLAIAGFLGLNIANENYTRMAFMGMGALVVAWSMFGRKVWWLPIFFFLFLGGHFYPGFKIYVHELAVLVCLAPLILTLAMKRETFKSRGFPIPSFVILLFLYLCIHFLVCVVDNKVEGIGGLGSVTRRYMDAIWPFLIFIPFLMVGNTKYVRWALLLVSIATVIRFSIGMYTSLQGSESGLFFIPGINFIPAGGFATNDLRFSGSMLCSVAICYFSLTKSFVFRFLLSLVILMGVWGTVLGGGRITIVLLLGLFGFVFLIYRRYGAMLLFAAFLAIFVGFVNSSPESLHSFPDMARRTASAFLIDRDMADDTAETRISDEWHFRLIEEGYKSWTTNLFTVLFGRGTRPFEERAWMEGKNFEGMVEMATVTSRFESGLWTVLCTFGLVGFILYLCLLIQIINFCWGILMRDKIATPVHAFMFLAVFQSITWIVLCWISGSFPSTQILFGVVAMVAAHDMKRKQMLDEEERTQRVLSLPPDPGSLVGIPMK